jgi:hypothetical protein
VRATGAPYVAFLAADNRARPGWIEGRLRRHREGAAAVGTAMAAPRGNKPALATHLLWHSSRMPHLHPAPIMRFGASYARALLERHGPFPEDIPREEDVVFNRRLLTAGVPIVWAPEVQTEAVYPLTARELLDEQRRRGRLRRSVQRHRPRAVLAARALADAPEGFLRAARGDVSARELAGSAPLVAAGALAAAGGVLSAGPRSPRSDRTPAAAGSSASAPPPARR